MTEETQNHYQVLGVERAADERTIKKAYFTLIRQFPPEKHPEEFKRIRAAYEVLSDPVARKRYDDAEGDFAEHGDDAARALKEAQAAIRAGDEAQAQKRLNEILVEQPELWAAHHMLGVLFLRIKEFQKALDVFRHVSQKRPEDAQALVHLGFAWDGLEKSSEAEAAYKAAYALSPDDVGIIIALADSYTQQQQYDASLRVLDAGLEKHRERGPARLTLELRRISVHYRKGTFQEAEQAVTALIASTREDPDQDLWVYASSRLAATAATLFARNEFASANHLLARCSELHPGSGVERPWVTQSFATHELPQSTQDHLAALEGGPTSPTLVHSGWAWPLAGALSSVAWLCVTLMILWDEPAPMTASRALWTGMSLAVSAVLGMVSARSLHASLTSNIGHLTTVTLLHLLSVTPRKVKAYPLFLVKNVRVVRHSTNGVYTHTQVEVTLSKGKFSVSIRDEGYASGWARYLLDQRQRAMELMFEGFLDAEPDAELIPAQASGNPRPKVAPSDVKWWGGALGSVVLAMACIVPMNMQRVDTVDLAAALEGNTRGSLMRYLADHPNGRHATHVQRLLERRFQRAVDVVKAAAVEGPGLTVLVTALEALKKQPAPAMSVVVESTGEGAASGPAAATHVAARVGAMFRQLGLDMVEVHTRADAPLTLRLERKVTVDGELESPGLPPVPRVVSVWTVKLAGAAEDVPLTLSTEPSARIWLEPQASPDVWRANAVAAQVFDEEESLVHQLAAHWGLADVAQLTLLGQPASAGRRSSY